MCVCAVNVCVCMCVTQDESWDHTSMARSGAEENARTIRVDNAETMTHSDVVAWLAACDLVAEWEAAFRCRLVDGRYIHIYMYIHMYLCGCDCVCMCVYMYIYMYWGRVGGGVAMSPS